MCDKIHPFEAAGLGKAPFRHVGMVDQEIRYGERLLGHTRNGVEITTKPGGSCDFCGTYIVNIFNIESADGSRFHVGCECVKKTGDVKLISRVNDEIKKQKKAKDDARIALAKRMLDIDFLHLNQWLVRQPHPTVAHLSLLDYVTWMFENAGRSGKLRAAAIVEKNYEDHGQPLVTEQDVSEAHEICRRVDEGFCD